MLNVEVSYLEHPYGTGLLSTSAYFDRLHEVSDPHLGQGITWEHDYCGPARLAPGMCDDPTDLVPDGDKVVEDPRMDEIQAFGVYRALECSPFYSDYEAKARRALLNGQQYAAETAFQALVLDHSPVHNAGTAYSPIEALATIENLAGHSYAGPSWISTSRWGATFMAELHGVKTRFHDDNLGTGHPYEIEALPYTALGTPIVAGSGYSRNWSNTAPTSPNGFFLWFHGPVDVYMGPIEYHQGYGLKTNTETGLAERIFAVTKPCYSIAIEVDPSL